MVCFLPTTVAWYCCSWIEHVFLSVLMISIAGWYGGGHYHWNQYYCPWHRTEAWSLLGCWPNDQLVWPTSNFVIRYEKQLTLLIDDLGLDLFFLSSVTMYKCTVVHAWCKATFLPAGDSSACKLRCLGRGGKPTVTDSTLALQLMSTLAWCPKWYARTIFAVHFFCAAQNCKSKSWVLTMYSKAKKTWPDFVLPVIIFGINAFKYMWKCQTNVTVPVTWQSKWG